MVDQRIIWGIYVEGEMKTRGVVLVAAWLVLLMVSRYLKFSFPIGEQSATLVCFSVVLPLIAYFFRARGASALVGGGWLLTHLAHPIPLTAGIPTLLATVSWRVSERRSALHYGMHVIFPLLAMALFVLTPGGRGAWQYSLYWLIPVGVAFMPPTLGGRAVQSTFVAHAAGSVMWAYFASLSSGQWLALIPVVAVERFLAVGLVVGVIGVLSPLARHGVLRSKEWSRLKSGDVLVFTNGKEEFEAVIEKIDRFDSLDAYLLAVGVEVALPGVRELEEARRIYLAWSTPEEIEKWGFLAIWVKCA